MRKKRKNCLFLLLPAAAFVLVTGTACAGYILSGTLGEGLALIPGSTADLKCTGTMTASDYLINTGDTAAVTLKNTGNPGDFTGYAKEHNRYALYTYEGVYRYLITAEGKEYESSRAVLQFDSPGDYQVKGYLTYRWKTSAGKVAAGFARYYYRTIWFTLTIRVRDLQSPDTVPPERPAESGESEKTEPAIAAAVKHTADWEKNRIAFNRWCRDRGRTDLLRSEDCFWSGERFVLEAACQGEQLPASVSVRIEGEPYGTTLRAAAGQYAGSLFDGTMIGRWGADGPVRLTFIFSAVIDGKHCSCIRQIIIDDRHGYWDMHRKE
ncbi:MAG: hypothetical protein ACI4LA_10260 [Emergencia sp.]